MLFHTAIGWTAACGAAFFYFCVFTVIFGWNDIILQRPLSLSIRSSASLCAC